ncbi:RodZ domain-containing protein [Lonepinella sp. BR2882]|uniref:RodZ domain-containing protein n=1 Tax=Lonepinella sp. BR2882 TaxID=3095283 RepID=UPI003F6DEFDC
MDTQINSAERITVGETFRQARQKLNLTIEQVAEKVNLRPIVVESIENNEFVQKNIPATFMKGYVRNYAEFLKLPDSLWKDGAIDFGRAVRNDLNKHVKVKKVVNPHSSHSRWVGWLTAFVLLFVIGMTALWWWENYQQTNSERDNLVQNYVSTEGRNKSLEHSDNVVIMAETAVVDSTQANAQIAESAVQNNPENSNAITNTDTNQQENTMESVNSPAQGILMQHTTKDNVTDSIAVEDNAQNTEDNVATGDLQIEIIAATSWIAVRDAKHHNLVTQKEYKQGEVITLDGKGPYALTIGAPSNVKITYKGEDYPLKIDGRVARIKLQ